jgi:dipeptidase D
MSGISSLEPERLWSIFSFICSIPHPSHREAALAKAIVERERSLGVEAEIDAAGNVILRKGATKGREGARGLILQAHLDMVPQAAAGVAHDFARDPIVARLDPADPAWAKATGTTLGADDGIGVAAAMALVESDDLPHGPLECLFTVNEEDGMDGAQGLAAGALRGELLLNLDSESADELCIGCAGSGRIQASLPLSAGKAPAGPSSWVEVSVGGLKGGHSGVDIHLGRGNAIRALAEILRSASSGAETLAAFEGGTASNAIPRSARALLLAPDSGRAAWESRLRDAAKAVAARLGAADPGLELAVSGAEPPAGAEALDPASTKRLLDLVLALPNGLLAMSEATPGIPRSSTSLGIAQLAREASGKFAFTATCAPRSESDDENERTFAAIEAIAAAAGGSSKRISRGPAWTPNPASPFLGLVREAFRDLNGRDCVVGATHGGLETAHFRRVFPSWDMVSVGPTIRYPHSPDEAVSVESVGRFWRLVAAVAARV